MPNNWIMAAYLAGACLLAVAVAAALSLLEKIETHTRHLVRLDPKVRAKLDAQAAE